MANQHAAVLAFCNELRHTLKRQPVHALRKGVMSTGPRCPVSNTLNYGSRNRVTCGTRGTYDIDPKLVPATFVVHPPAVQNFIVAFDAGRLPDFVGQGWAE